MKWWSVLILVLLCALRPQEVTAADQAVAVRLGQRELFLDDHVIAEINQLHRRMHQPAKKGAVIRADPGSHVVISQGAPFWDPREKVFKYWVYGYRQSPDGLNWTKVPGLWNVMLNGVFYDATDPDEARRYKSFTPTAFHVSPDGLNWTKLDVPPVPSSDTSSISFDAEDRLYIATVKHDGVYGRSVFLSTSRDFEHWSDPVPIFEADELDQELARRRILRRFADPTRQDPEYNIPEHYGADVYRLGAFRYEGLYVGLPMIFHHTGTVTKDWAGFDRMHLSDHILGLVRKYGDYTGFHHVQLACSRDLHHWQRLGHRQPFIDTSPVGSGAYDTQTLSSPYDVLRRGDELWFYYSGFSGYAFISSGEEPGYDDYHPDAGAICLAVLRRDGFISLDGQKEPGSIVTRTLHVPQGASRLLVNADVLGGELTAMLLTAASQPLEGFIVPQVIPVPGATTRTYPLPMESAAISGDHLRAELTWEGHEDLSILAGKQIRIRFRLREGSLFSFWFE